MRKLSNSEINAVSEAFLDDISDAVYDAFYALGESVRDTYGSVEEYFRQMQLAAQRMGAQY